ncbi:hypothetical protein AJ78_02670 [Emergomyces pasteurianus Ep9510]|uniref:Aminoglycoside phosphotransferase domain-containing protein n=1 Tax=Emergomyces pasteurianus Ep9510 TaxID=1447872 RepID=A0A1J9PLC2_9EURO|nr:hypothetical protein AJ78_02670 [Emergomyces pasteurianus Ep9510]
MAAITAMRTIFPLFLQRGHRRGPFCFHLTDLHQSNILVDENSHITYLIDLEWACSLPIDMIAPPYWLLGGRLDELNPENYDETRKEFMSILLAEEPRMQACAVNQNDIPQLSDVINRS